MIVSPSLFVCILVAAEDQQSDIICFSNADSFGDQSLILCQIAEMSTVRKPIATLFSYLAAFGILYFNSVTNFVFDPLEHANTSIWIIAVTTEMHLRCVWPNYSDRLQRVAI